MRITSLLVLVVILVGLAGCSYSAEQSVDTSKPESAYPSRAASEPAKESLAAANTRTVPAEFQPVSLNQVDSLSTVAQAAERKIIRNANVTLEVTSPTETQRRIASIAETHQGFVVTSEATQRKTEDPTKLEINVSLVVRVPATQFNQTMEEIRAAGARVMQEKIAGQDVTEEFMDLEARIKNQKALESQFLEIMKRAGQVEDAMSVQRQLAEVRTEIEKLEGRRRFLENQSSLSTINVTLQPPSQIINATGFWYGVKSAFKDGRDVALGILLFLIRAVVALLPIALFFGLPLALITRFVVRRLRRRPAREAEATA